MRAWPAWNPARRCWRTGSTRGATSRPRSPACARKRRRCARSSLIAGVRPKLPNVFVEIVGYSDNLGLDSQNRRVALERAEAVRRYLHETGGIPLDRLSTISYGDLKPLASNVTAEGRGQNRRVWVRVLR